MSFLTTKFRIFTSPTPILFTSLSKALDNHRLPAIYSPFSRFIRLYLSSRFDVRLGILVIGWAAQPIMQPHF
jgi:hypothetical protein